MERYTRFFSSEMTPRHLSPFLGPRATALPGPTAPVYGRASATRSPRHCPHRVLQDKPSTAETRGWAVLAVPSGLQSYYGFAVNFPDVVSHFSLLLPFCEGDRQSPRKPGLLVLCSLNWGQILLPPRAVLDVRRGPAPGSDLRPLGRALPPLSTVPCSMSRPEPLRSGL